MDLFTLSATLGLDYSGFSSGLSAAEALANSAVPGLGTVLSKVGGLATKALSTAGSAAVDFSKDVLNTGINFDKAMAGVYAVTDATEDYRQSALKTAVINEAMGSSFTTAEVAAAAYYEGLAGYDDEEIIAGLHGLVVAAEASGEGIQKTADIITDTVRAFGDSAAEQEHYADVFAATATNTNTTIGLMGNAMKYVAPIAGALGYKVEDVAISLGVMADSGIKGSMAGTALRNVFTRLSTDTGATSNSLGALGIMTNKLGVEFYDSSGKVRPWIDVVKEARVSWKGFTDEEKQTAAQAFGELSSGAETSTDSLNEFVKEVESLNSDLSDGKIDIYEYNSSVEALSGQFSILGISVKDANGNYKDAQDLLDQTTAKVDGLTDAQQVSYSKQIASQRGMSGWLSLMNATDEKFDETTEAIYGCAGAAERMRDIRLNSNLAGDLEQLNSRFDALKTLIFGEVEGPLRELAQWAIGALDRINAAVSEDGIIGGFKQLATEINGFWDTYGDSITDLVRSAVPIIADIFTELAPALTNGLTILFNNVASGLLQGLGETLSKSDNPMLKYVGQMLTEAYDVIQYGIEHDLSDNLSLTSADMGTVSVDADVQLNPHLVDMIQSELDEAISSGKTTVKINGFEFSTDYTAQEIADAITEGAKNGSAEMQAVVDSYATSSANTMQSLFTTAISSGGASGASAMSNSLYSTGSNVSWSIFKLLVTNIGNAGTSGGSSAAGNVESQFRKKESSLKNTVSSILSGAGTGAGNGIASGIQRVLSMTSFGISIVGTLTDIFSGSKRYASAMHNGRILHGSTIFGVDNEGDALIGGDAGPEAIIGTDELSRLIAKAVYAGSQQSTTNTINIYQQPGESAEELAERVQRVLARQGRQRRTVYA